MSLFSWFENRVDPYPDTPPPQPPAGFFNFVWAATKGLRPLIAGMTVLTAVIGAFEALLFSMLGSVVDWLSQVPTDQLWATQKGNLLLLAAILLASPLLIGPSLRQSALGRVFDALNPFSAAVNAYDAVIIDSQSLLAQALPLGHALLWLALTLWFARAAFHRVSR